MAALLALLSSLMWGTADFLGGTASRRLPAVAVYGGSQLVGFGLMVAVATATGSWGADPAFWPWAVLSSLAGAAGMVAFYAALASGTMGIVSPAAALSVLVPLTVGLARGESPAPQQVLGIVAAVGGVLLASGPELSDAASTRPVLLALVAALMFGLMYVWMAAGSQISVVMTMTGMRVTTLVVVVVAVVATRSVGGLAWRDAPTLATLGVLDAGANLAWGLAATMGLLSLTAVLGSLYPVVTAVLAGVVLHERLRAVQYAGVVFALSGVLLISAGG